MSLYVEYRLIETELLKERGREGSVVLTVGVLIKNDKGASDLMELAKLVEASPTEIATQVKERAKLAARASEPGIWPVYHCAECGHSFKKNTCRSSQHLGVSFPSLTFSTHKSVMPPKVLTAINQMKKNKHIFLIPPPKL